MISLKIIFLNLINYLYSPQKKPGSSPARLFLFIRVYSVLTCFICLFSSYHDRLAPLFSEKRIIRVSRIPRYSVKLYHLSSFVFSCFLLEKLKVKFGLHLLQKNHRYAKMKVQKRNNRPQGVDQLCQVEIPPV